MLSERENRKAVTQLLYVLLSEAMLSLVSVLILGLLCSSPSRPTSTSHNWWLPSHHFSLPTVWACPWATQGPDSTAGHFCPGAPHQQSILDIPLWPGQQWKECGSRGSESEGEVECGRKPDWHFATNIQGTRNIKLFFPGLKKLRWQLLLSR